MNPPALVALLQNASLLLAMVVVFELATRGTALAQRPLRQTLVGGVVGGLGIAVMMGAYPLEPGVVFDTRSVLIGLCGLFLGLIPTTVAMMLTGGFRLSQGGAAALTGLWVILASGLMGVAWRHYRRQTLARMTWGELLGFGFLIHGVMLLLMFTLPWERALEVVAAIGIPVLLIHPVATMVVGLLLVDRLRREAAAEALAESEARYRALFENNHAAMLVINPEHGLIEDANPAACRFYGWTREQLRRMRISDLNALPWDRVQAEMARARSDQRYHFLFPHRLANGSLRDVEVFSGPVVYGGQTLLYSIIHDITEQRQAEQALRDSEERFRRAILESPFPSMLHAEDGEILQLSQSWCELSGYTREELRTIDDWTERAYGQRQADVKSGIDALYPLEHRQHEGDFSVRTKAGNLRCWEFSSAPLGRLPDGRRLVLSMASDVTERRTAESAAREAFAQLEESRRALLSLVEDQREAEAQVRRLNEDLERRVSERTAQLEVANRELEAFSYSVSHDLRAPLRHISGYVNLLRRQMESQLNEPGRRYLTTIAESAVEMGRLIDDLLSFSRVGRADMNRVSINLGDLIRQEMDMASRESAHPSIEWRIQALPEVHADLKLLRLVLANLLSNAIKYSRTRTPPVIEVGGQTGKHEVVIYVRDNGVGFDMRYADKLFGVFQRLHSASEFEGTGIGLANVRRIIHRHGGRTWAEGAVDRGATFYFSLPLLEKPTA